jgi:hypothetical protein
MNRFFTSNWPFVAAGGALAFLLALALYLLNTPVGMSDAYLMISEYCEEVIKEQSISEWPIFDWQTGFLGGIFIGALVASAAGGEFKFELFPDDRKDKAFMKSSIVTPLHGIICGFLVMFGLQLAGDSFMGQCASALQLSTGAWLFLGSCVFSAIFAALIMSAKLEKGDE